MKKPTLCTDTTAYDKLDNPELIRIYKGLATERMTAKAIAQLISVGQFSLNEKTAILNAFRVPRNKLTKKEKKVAALAYEISQTDLAKRIYQTLFYNDKLANNMKLLAQMKQYISESTNAADSIAAALNISLTDKKAKTPPEKEEGKKDNKINSKVSSPEKPLRLVNND